MAKGLALNIGLNAVDPKHYDGWSGELNACEADAEDMGAIAKAAGFKVSALLTKAATRAAVTKRIASAAKALAAGDIFFLTYSGHGGQLPDLNNDEDDGLDETWCLYDGELVDDEIYALLGKFRRGVRILSLSDSCHSGTVLKLALNQGTAGIRGSAPNQPHVARRCMPLHLVLRVYRKHRQFYDRILKQRSLRESKKSVVASALLISGCMDNQFSGDGVFNGVFTGRLLEVWNNGSFHGNYTKFHKTIVRGMPPDQVPNLFRVGEPNPEFEAQKPFTV